MNSEWRRCFQLLDPCAYCSDRMLGTLWRNARNLCYSAPAARDITPNIQHSHHIINLNTSLSLVAAYIRCTIRRNIFAIFVIKSPFLVRWL